MQVMTPFSFLQTDAAMIPFDTSKLLFQAQSTLNGGSFTDSHPRPFQIKNVSNKDLLLTWVNGSYSANFGFFNRQTLIGVTIQGIPSLTVSGIFIPKNQSVFTDFLCINFSTTSIAVTYTGTMTLTEIAGWAFDSVAGFDSVPLSLAAAPASLVDGISFKFQPNIVCPLNFFYNESGGG
jgi:hypothetical protein